MSIALLGSCAGPKEVAAPDGTDWVGWLDQTFAKWNPEILGAYVGQAEGGSWRLEIRRDDSFLLTMLDRESTSTRSTRGTWLVFGGSLGTTWLALMLHSEDGAEVVPPRMFATFSPPDRVYLNAPGPDWFVEVPGSWECLRSREPGP